MNITEPDLAFESWKIWTEDSRQGKECMHPNEHMLLCRPLPNKRFMTLMPHEAIKRRKKARKGMEPLRTL